MVVFEGFTT